LFQVFGEKQMKQNVTFSIGNVALINKVDDEYGYFNRIFGGIYGKAKNHIPSIKLFIQNRLSKCVSVNRLKDLYPTELFTKLGFSEIPSDRSLYREIERVGKKFQFILERQQRFIKEEGLLCNKQFMDFSSSYFEGTSSGMGKFGYSRDHRPDKKQINFGVSVGINGIPSALTIQKGNVCDKTHFSFMLRTANAVLEDNSLLIFDCGANTKKNKKDIRNRNYHYLTLKQKQVAQLFDITESPSQGNGIQGLIQSDTIKMYRDLAGCILGHYDVYLPLHCQG